MKLYELLKTCDKDELIKYLANADDRNEPVVYEQMLDKLLNMTPAENSDMKILVCTQNDPFDNGTYYDVSGAKKGDEQSYALEFMPWNEWLASEVAQKPIDEYGLATVLGEIMYEMSFISFEEDEIQQSMASLSKQCEEIKNGTAKLYPMPEHDHDPSFDMDKAMKIGENNETKRKEMLD